MGNNKYEKIRQTLAWIELNKIRLNTVGKAFEKLNLNKEGLKHGECAGCAFRDQNNLPRCIGCPVKN